jgi:hypothetical protein
MVGQNDEAPLAARGQELNVRDRLMKAWSAVTLQRFFGIRPVVAAEQRHRPFAEPPALRHCLRCSKIECSTS